MSEHRCTNIVRNVAINQIKKILLYFEAIQRCVFSCLCVSVIWSDSLFPRVVQELCLQEFPSAMEP